MKFHGFHDEERSVLVMEGGDARAVLQGVVTNDVERLAPDRLVYAALLTPQGKYLFDFFLASDGPRILIDVARNRAGALAQRIGMYCLRRDARVIGDSGLHVTLSWPADPGVYAEPPQFENAIILRDPREASLGWRMYANSAVPVGEVASRQEYDRLRIANKVPETGVELIPEETFVLEAGFERLSGVDFRKGCYVGQEVTARMKHKTELRKGIDRVSVTGQAAPGTPIIADGKPAGVLYSVCDGAGLAHLRFDRAGIGMVAGEATVDYPPRN